MAKKKKPAGGPDVIEGKAAEVKKKKRTSPLEFIQQVRNEAAKVTWTSRNETLVSTVMVLIMVAIMALFFFGVDQGLRFAVCNVLPIDCVGANN
ncbi:MAG: preprotein translocase subunit SecE [Parvularcula sp.]|uniref:preprotein translocase subunit SecE n=1 Tax=Hyphococcus sp. TaxID=2038636 RepID=UPI000C3A6542|nr:preprotein translocase subunit SecE [Parvularcula sp.]